MKHHPDLRAAVARAVARARGARRPPTAYDLFGALIEAPDVHLLIHRTGGDADVLASGLDSAASVLPSASLLGRAWPIPVPDPSFGRVIGLASRAAVSSKTELAPADVFVAGFDAGDAGLVAVLEGAGLSRASVRRWHHGDHVQDEERVPVDASRRAGGVLAALARRLTWRVPPPDDVSSSDAVIATCGIAALGVWLAFDRYSAGAAALLYPGGTAGLTWYAAGLLALAWIVHRVSGAPTGFRSVLAPLVGLVPLALVVALAFHTWAPAPAHAPVIVLLASAALFHLGRVLAGVGASRPRAAIFAASAFIAIFAWATEVTYVRPHVWFAVNGDGDADEWASSERLLFEQADRIDAAAERVRPGDPDRPSVFFLGFAGTGEQKVFAEETKLAERVVSERYGAAGRTLLLVNDQRDLETLPLATVPGLRRALARLAQRMDVSKDVLFLFLTSHGSAQHSLTVSNTTWPLQQLDPTALREALDASGIRWRVVVVAACYSGGFIPALAGDETAIFTSAAADRVSFGCSDDRDATEFGEAFFRDAVPGAPSLAAAFEGAKQALAEEEKRRNMTESLPQAKVGAAIAAHWERVESQNAASRRSND